MEHYFKKLATLAEHNINHLWRKLRRSLKVLISRSATIDQTQYRPSPYSSLAADCYLAESRRLVGLVSTR